MTKLEFTKLATQKFSKLSIEELIKSADRLKNEHSDTSSCMFDAVIDLLFKRMPDQDFIKFCDNLYE
jgi:hypothetical protein